MTGLAVPVLLAVATAATLWTLPRWLPPAVIWLRQWVFARVNGTEGIPVPGPLVGAEHFEKVYANPAADGRSRGAGLSDLFWYWLAPGPHMHQEHLEPGERYRTVARATRRVLAVSHDRSTELAGAAARRQLDRLPADQVSRVRLRDFMQPVWAEVYYELVFGEPCPPDARALIVANADDVVTALKCCGLRHMDRRDRLTRYLRARVDAGTAPVVLPEPFTAQETAWWLQGAFFNTAVVQMSEAMAHLLLAIAQHPPTQLALRRALDGPAADADRLLDRVIDETMRVHPLFGVAHRITSTPIEVTPDVTLPAGSVLLFNYLAYQRTGPAADDEFDPDRWLRLSRREAHFLPFGVTANRACPARGVAPVMMRAVTREVLRRYALVSSVRHDRSLPSRGPCYLVPAGPAADAAAGPAADAAVLTAGAAPGRLRLWSMRTGDRWADVWRSLVQLVLGTVMVLHARRLRLCANHFDQAEPSTLPHRSP